MTDEASFLARVSVFSSLTEKELERIAALMKRLVFGRGDFIIREGDDDTRLFVIVSGEVEVIRDFGGRKERCARTLGPYGYFGEMSLIDDLVRSASVRAKEDTQVLCLDRWDLRSEIERNPSLAIHLLQMLSRRIRTNEKTMAIALEAFLPTCANCRSIREPNGSWTPIEEYLADRSETEFGHGICPKCAKKLYPQYAKRLSPGNDKND